MNWSSIAKGATSSGVVGGAIGAVGSIIGNLGQKRRDKLNQIRQHKYNKELAQYNYDNNLNMWNLQNEYNTPRAQMQRLKEAGINPHMAYAKGAPENISGAGPTFEQKGQDMALPTAINPQNTLSQYQNFRSQNAQIDNVQQDSELKAKDQNLRDTQNDLTQLQVLTQHLENTRRGNELDYHQQFLKKRLQQAESNLANDLVNRSSTRAGIGKINATTKLIGEQTKTQGEVQKDYQAKRPNYGAQRALWDKQSGNIYEDTMYKAWQREYRNEYGTDTNPSATGGALQILNKIGRESQIFHDKIIKGRWASFRDYMSGKGKGKKHRMRPSQ